MKRLSLLLLTALLALTASALHLADAKPVHAADFACGFADTDGVPVLDFYQKTSDWIIGTDGGSHQVNNDLAIYRVTMSGVCEVGAYASTWFTDHSFSYQYPHLNLWSNWPYDCGWWGADQPQCLPSQMRGPWSFNHGQTWDWGNYVISGAMAQCETCSQWGPWGSHTFTVTFPNNATLPLDFGHMGGAPARFYHQATTEGSYICDAPGGWGCWRNFVINHD